MTIDAAPQQQPAKGSMRGCYWIVPVLLIPVLVALLLPAIQTPRGPSRGNACRNKLKTLGIALQNYCYVHRNFPPAYVADADGRPMHSWRVLILPYLEEGELYKRYRFDEPWNGPNNSKLAAEFHPDQFRCPTATGPAQETSYVVVTGAETMFPVSESLKVRDVRDGTSKTIAIVEVANSGIHWMEPRDMTLDDALAGINAKASHPTISSNHGKGAMATYADSHVGFLPDDCPVDKLRALLTASGGESVSEPSN